MLEVVLGHDVRYIDGEPMTLITFDSGKVVMRDGKVGTEQECCCDDEPCVCPPCSDEFSFSVAWAGLTATTTTCFDGGYSGAAFEFNDDGLIAINVSATCEDGNWTLSASLCYDQDGCLVASNYSVVIPCEDVDEDGFPSAGAVTLQQDSYNANPAGCGPGAPTSATVAK